MGHGRLSLHLSTNVSDGSHLLDTLYIFYASTKVDVDFGDTLAMIRRGQPWYGFTHSLAKPVNPAATKDLRT